jgi:4-hydroxy-2-oxoheptanedioate aldolase
MKTPINTFKRALLQQRAQIGLWCTTGAFQVVEIVANAGFDWLCLDTEHTPIDITSLHLHLMAANAGDSHPVVRPPWNDMVWIKRCMDIGTQTLLIPYVQSAAEAAQAVSFSRFPNRGVRGVAGSTRASGFQRYSDYFAAADTETCVLVQVETQQGIDNLDAICQTPGIDGVFIGPSDLAAALGHLGNPMHADVQAVIVRALKRIRELGKAPGILTNEANARRYLDAGALFVAVASDLVLLRSAADELAGRFADLRSGR